MRIVKIAIDVDGSPSGFISWHNHFLNKSKIRIIKPYKKNERFGVQRMEILAIYFGLLDNLKAFKSKLKRKKKIITIRSDSKSTVELLNNKVKMRDDIIRRVYNAITRILEKISCELKFNHLNRNKNAAGKILESIRKDNNNNNNRQK